MSTAFPFCGRVQLAFLFSFLHEIEASANNNEAGSSWPRQKTATETMIIVIIFVCLFVCLFFVVSVERNVNAQ